jgi:macrolide-specific efflux system membrane fusion protein
MRLKIAVIVVLLAVGGGAVAIAAGALSPTATNATTLLTATAAVTDVTDEIAATGTVEAASQYDLAFGTGAVETSGSTASTSAASSSGSLAASVSWPVTAVKVAVGDHVTAGQVLATADTSDLDAQIADAGRAASSAAIQLKQAKTDRSNATDTASRRQTQIALYNAETADAKAKSDLAALQALRRHTTLTAPADGTVIAVAIAPGGDAPDGAAITMISGDLRIATSVVESDIAAIKVDQEATVAIAALDASLVGKVVSIDPVGAASGTNGVVTFAVEVKLDSPPARLRPGMSADITIVAASATNVIAIPSRALSGTADAYTVRVMADDGSVSVQDVQVGLVTSSLAEIKSGLQAGERVVTGTSSNQNTTTTTGGAGGGAFPGGGIIRGGR